MNVILAVNSRPLEKYVSDLKEINILKSVKSGKSLLEDIVLLNPHIVIISRYLPCDYDMKDLILNINKNLDFNGRIIFLYGEDDIWRKQFTNFLIENNIYDFHVGDIEEDTITELLFNAKKRNEVKLEEITEEEKELMIEGDFDELSEKEPKEQELQVHIIEKIEEVERIVEVEKIVEKTVTITKEKIVEVKPNDYRKVVGFLGIPNSGNSTLSLMCSAVIGEQKRVAIIDLSENQNFKYYFAIDDEQKESLEKNKQIKLSKNLYLYPKEIISDDILAFIDKLKQNFDVIVLDLGSSFNINYIKLLDNLYLTTDNDITHAKEISNYLKLIKEYDIIHKKVKIVYNKIINEKHIKNINEISHYDFEKQEVIKKDNGHFIINFIYDINLYNKIMDFDVSILRDDKLFNLQVKNISDDIYYVEKKESFFNKIRKIFRRKLWKRKIYI